MTVKKTVGILALAGCFLGLPARAAENRAEDFDPAPYLGTRWYGAYLMGNKVGYGSFRLAKSDYHGRRAYTSESSISYRLNLGGRTQKMSIREEKIYLPGQGLVAFSSAQDSLLGHSSFTGLKKNGLFEVITPTGREEIPAPEEKLADALADLVLVHSQAPPGTTVETTQFETTLLTTVRIKHTVDSIEKRFISGVPTTIYRITSEFPQLGIKTLSLIDQHLHILESKMGGVLTIREEGEKEAKDMGYASDLLLMTSITPDRPVPDPRHARSLTLKLSGIGDTGLLLSSPRQRFEKLGPQTYYLKIAVQEDPDVPALRLPVPDADLKPYLKPTAYLQSTHPSVRHLAQEIVGNEKNANRVTEKLVNWVYQNLEKSFLAAIPNALDVLKKRSGDCKAHSVLFVALARSLGLPARQVSGLVEIEDGKFYYHQWAEVHTGRWIPVDPVFGQVRADATHIKLSQGDMVEQLRLLNIIGTVSIEVLDYQIDEETGGHLPTGV